MHKRDLASSLCSANSVIVMGHPKYESACGDTAVQHTKQPEPAWAAAARLCLQMCCSPCRCALLLAVAATLAFHLSSSFERTSHSEMAFVALSD